MKKIHKILSGDLLKSDFIKKNARYIIFLFGMVFLYILYGSIGVFQIAKIDEKQIEIENLRQKSILYSSELMKVSLESEVYQQVVNRNMDIQKLSEPPQRIIINKKNSTK